jgi:small-conductance mechanosensitive channel
MRRHRLDGLIATLKQIPYLTGRLVLDLLPVAAFAATADIMLGTPLGDPVEARLVSVEAVQAYILTRAILAACAFLFSPAKPRLRLLGVTDWAAEFLTRWARRIVIIIVGSFALADIGELFGMDPAARLALLKLLALAAHICAIVAVLQARAPVAARLHLRRTFHGVWAMLLNRMAERWHLVAIVLIVGLWLVWAVQIQNGYERLLTFIALTVGVLFGARLLAVVLLGGLERVRLMLPDGAGRLGFYYPILRGMLLALIWFFTGVALLEVWGVPILLWVTAGGLGGRVLDAIFTIVITILLAVVGWEAANSGLERHMATLSSSSQLARAGRVRTLLPLLRTTLMVTLLLIVGMIVLSAIGVNIAPLLAGAGVLGIAIGFGSQKLVQDLITGLFLLLENAMQVGDVVTVGGLTGTVEALSIRTIRLRATDGSVHLIPFSAVTTVTNQTRDYGYAVLDVSIGLNEESAPVEKVLRDVAAEMQADPEWQSIILDNLDVMGVDKLTDLAWIMRVRIKTQPGSRWAVARELNRRIKQRFDELAIESPFTSHRVLSRDPPVPQVAPPEAEAAE